MSEPGAVESEAAWRRGVALAVDEVLKSGGTPDVLALSNGDPSRTSEVEALIEVRRAILQEFADGEPEDLEPTESTPLETAERVLSEACERGEVADLGVLEAEHPELRENFEELSRFYRFLVDALTGEAAPLETGRGLPQRRLGKFVLERVIGPHPVGRIDAAFEERTGARRVLHLLSPTLPKTSALRLLRGATAVRRLADPGFAPLVEVGEAESVRYLAYEDVGGASLDQIVERGSAPGASTDVRRLAAEVAGASGGAPTPREPARYDAARLPSAAAVVVAVAEALHRAHAQGVLHLDLRPSNVVVAADGRVLLRGANLVSSMPAAWKATGAGRAFIAPETTGSDGASADWRADVYGCAALLYLLLRMEPPPTDPAEARARLEGAPESVRDFVARGLAVEPKARPSSCLAASEVLAPYARGAGRRRGRHAKKIAVAAALIALATAILIYAI